MTSRHVSLLAALLIAALFCLSFLLPTAMLGSPQRPDWYPGWMIFLMGWMGPFIGQFGWFANFLVPLAVLDLAKGAKLSRKFSTALAVILLMLAINSAFWGNIPNDASMGSITRYGIGYYFWMAAVIFAGAALVSSRTLLSQTRAEDGHERLQEHGPKR